MKVRIRMKEKLSVTTTLQEYLKKWLENWDYKFQAVWAF